MATANGVQPGAPQPTAPRAPNRLHVVHARRIRARTQRRRSRTLLVGAGVVFVTALLLVVAGQALVASQQVELDNLQQQLSSAVATNANLQLRRAELESPARVLQLAEQRLGMVTPKSVVYLTPVDPGPSVATTEERVPK